MNPSPYLLFHQSPEQLRRIGARGGKAQGRNRRDRLGGEPYRPPQRVAPLLPAPQSTAAAIAALDAQFPWLRGAEKRRTPSSPQPDRQQSGGEDLERHSAVGAQQCRNAAGQRTYPIVR